MPSLGYITFLAAGKQCLLKLVIFVCAYVPPPTPLRSTTSEIVLRAARRWEHATRVLLGIVQCWPAKSQYARLPADAASCVEHMESTRCRYHPRPQVASMN